MIFFHAISKLQIKLIENTSKEFMNRRLQNLEQNIETIRT